MRVKTRVSIAISAMLISSYSSAQITDQQIKDFFATNPTPEQIASAAASLGMNESQISSAMGVANYGGNQASRDAAINGWVANQNNGYAWGANGSVVQQGQQGAIGAAGANTASLGARAFGSSASWANGSQRFCPDGMTVGINRAGAPKCLGTPTPLFPMGEAAINLNAAPKANDSNGRIFADPMLNAGSSFKSNTGAQEYSGPTIGEGGSTAGFIEDADPVGQKVKDYYASMGISWKNVDEQVLASKYQEISLSMGVNGRVGTTGATYFSPTLGQSISDADVRAFFASNPSQAQIMAKAAELGLSASTVDNMMTSQGMSNVDSGYGTRLNHFNSDLWTGQNGYSTNAQGKVVAGGGHVAIDEGNGSMHWGVHPTTTLGGAMPGNGAGTLYSDPPPTFLRPNVPGTVTLYQDPPPGYNNPNPHGTPQPKPVVTRGDKHVPKPVVTIDPPVTDEPRSTN